jgi:hypothetical protein
VTLREYSDAGVEEGMVEVSHARRSWRANMTMKCLVGLHKLVESSIDQFTRECGDGLGAEKVVVELANDRTQCS